MTFSICGRCEKTGQLGIAISSSSIAVGSRCVWIKSKVGAVASQNITLPSLGNDILEVLNNSEKSKINSYLALNQIIEKEKYKDYRQVAVIDFQGNTAVFTGKNALGINSSKSGKNCVSAGNLLANNRVINEIILAFENSTGDLAKRLIKSMETGLLAGGEAGPVHSAALKIIGTEVSWPIIDLRVDWTENNPIEELNNLWQSYQPQMQDYLTRALNPTIAPKYGVAGNE